MSDLTREEVLEMCKIRHEPIDSQIKALFRKVDWIYIFVILSLGGILANIATTTVGLYLKARPESVANPGD